MANRHHFQPAVPHPGGLFAGKRLSGMTCEAVVQLWFSWHDDHAEDCCRINRHHQGDCKHMETENSSSSTPLPITT